MDTFTTLFIACGLAMDAFAVSVTSGLTIRTCRMHHAIRIALFFGVFQAVMPVLGWIAARQFSHAIEAVDHWLAFCLLSFIGVKMIVESFRLKPPDRCINPLKLSVLLVLAVATSIDALAVGLSLAFLNVDIVTPVVVIGLVTFGFSLAGVWIGKTFGHLFEQKVEIIGGLILIAIGLKILVEHLST